MSRWAERAVQGAIALLAGAALGLTGCRRSPAPLSSRPPPAPAVVVASFNFPESELLAEIYAQALEHVGIPVRRQLNLGTRELVQPAMRQGLVDLVPEYLGSALASLEPPDAAPPADQGEATTALAKDLSPWGFQVLTPAAAQNQNGFAVTHPLAEREHLVTVGDLARLGGDLTLTGPSECPSRPLCEPGLARTYGVHVGRFVPLDSEDQRAAALTEGVATVAVMFTTDGQLATGDYVLLQDDRHLQPPENVVPVVSSQAVARYGPPLTDALNAISSRLTTQGLTFLNWRVGLAGKDPTAEATGWLQRQGLLRASP